MSVYDIGGWVEDLPDLNTGRRDHGCGHYVDINNNTVRLVRFLFLLIFKCRSTSQLVDGVIPTNYPLLKY